MTILFRQDWGLHPDCKPDFKTSNSSAVKYAGILTKMGVNNNLFHLALYDQELVGVDPFDPDLSLEMKARIMQECKINFWYFLREVVRIPAQAGATARPFIFHRGNISVLWLMFNHITTFYLAPRQVGKTVTADVLNLYMTLFGTGNSTINLLTKDSGLRTENMLRLREFRDALPEYCQFKSRLDASNTENFTVVKNKNYIRGHVPATSPKSAEKKGRGLSAAINTVDEAAFINYAQISIPAMVTSGTKHRNLAKEYGAPYYTLLTTTAGSTSTEEGKYIYGMIKDSAPWNEKYYDAQDEESLEAVIRGSSRTSEPRVDCTFYYYMVGMTKEEFDRNIEASMLRDPIAIAKDFHVKWWRGTEGSAIARELLKIMGDFEVSPNHSDIDASFTMKWYVSEQAKQSYRTKPIIIGCDPSEGIGSDSIGIVVQDPETGAVVASGVCNTVNIISFSNWFYDYWIKGFPQSVSIIEKRSSGATIIDQLLILMESDGINPFERLFNRLMHDGGPDLYEKYKEVRRVSSALYAFAHKHRNQFGFSTSGSGVTSRANLYGNVLAAMAETIPHVLRDKELIEQLGGLEIRNGRVDHRSGGHDDLCIALVLNWWMLSQGRNLEEYGLNIHSVLKYISAKPSEDDVGLSDEQIAHRERFNRNQETLRRELMHEVSALNKCRDNVYSMQIKARINNLQSRITTHAGEDLSIAGLIAKIESQEREERHARQAA